MNRFIAAFALASMLASCSSGGGSSLSSSGSSNVALGTCKQPLVADTTSDCATTDSVATPDPADPNVYGSAMNADLTVSGMSYDPATDQVVFDNVPFDGDNNVYVRNAAASANMKAVMDPLVQARAGRAFSSGIYENSVGTARDAAGNPVTQFFAVFRRSPSDYGQAGALGTNRYLSYGFGGIAAQRLNGDGSLPNANQSYIFTGEYAGVRTITEDGAATEIQYVAGTTKLDVDIQDFNNVGAVEGIIASRRFFDRNGIEITSMAGGVGDFISLATAKINFDNWTITSAPATLQIDNSVDKDTTPIAAGDGKTQSASGNWAGIFTGPNGEEVAGIVFVEGTGPVGIDPATGTILTSSTVREVGTFAAERN